MRDRRFKYVRNHNDIDEFYDLESDPTEQHNLALGDDLNPELFWGMKRKLDRRLREGPWGYAEEL